MRTKSELKRAIQEAERKEGERIRYPDTVYWTKGSLLLDKEDRYVVDLYSYDDMQQTPPLREHFREVFDTRDQALEYAERLNECDFPKIYRQIILYDDTTGRPHYEIRLQVGY